MGVLNNGSVNFKPDHLLFGRLPLGHVAAPRRSNPIGWMCHFLFTQLMLNYGVSQHDAKSPKGRLMECKCPTHDTRPKLHFLACKLRNLNSKQSK